MEDKIREYYDLTDDELRSMISSNKRFIFWFVVYNYFIALVVKDVIRGRS